MKTAKLLLAFISLLAFQETAHAELCTPCRIRKTLTKKFTGGLSVRGPGGLILGGVLGETRIIDEYKTRPEAERACLQLWTELKCEGQIPLAK